MRGWLARHATLAIAATALIVTVAVGVGVSAMHPRKPGAPDSSGDPRSQSIGRSPSGRSDHESPASEPAGGITEGGHRLRSAPEPATSGAVANPAASIVESETETEVPARPPARTNGEPAPRSSPRGHGPPLARAEPRTVRIEPRAGTYVATAPAEAQPVAKVTTSVPSPIAPPAGVQPSRPIDHSNPYGP